MPRRKFLSLNQVANYLEVTREGVLLLELHDEDFPEHITDDSDRVFWDADEIEAWADNTDYYESEE